MLVPLNITGETYQSRSLPLSAQVTRNFYPEVQDNPSTQSNFVLHPFPGCSLFGEASGINRGAFFHVGTLYKVTGTALYTVNASGTHTVIGSIPGSARCIFAPIGSNIVIVTEGRAFYYNGTVIAEVIDADLETPSSAAHINNQIIYDGDGGRFAAADVGDPTSIDGLNYASAESDADNLVRVYVFDQILYLLGETTIEPWFNSGIGKPPFDRIQGGILQVGLAALHSVSHNSNSMYWLANDNHVYRISSGQHQRVTNLAFSREVSTYSDAVISAAQGSCMNWQGQEFYQLNFEGRSFCLSENSGQWFEVGGPSARSLYQDHIYAFRKHLATGYADGKIYELSEDTHTNDGAAIIRQRDTGPLHGALFGAPGKEFEVNRFQLIMGAGNGAVTGQGVDPEVMLQVSPDGQTWSTEIRAHTGRQGQFLYEVEWGPLGVFDACVFRVSSSDPVPLSIYSAAADVSVCI